MDDAGAGHRHRSRRKPSAGCGLSDLTKGCGWPQIQRPVQGGLQPRFAIPLEGRSTGAKGLLLTGVGSDADRRAKLLIPFTSEGSRPVIPIRSALADQSYRSKHSVLLWLSPILPTASCSHDPGFRRIVSFLSRARHVASGRQHTKRRLNFTTATKLELNEYGKRPLESADPLAWAL